MKLCKIAIGSPVYTEVVTYPGNRIKKVVVDPCRKLWILRMEVRIALSLESGIGYLQSAIDYFKRVTGSDEVMDLSSFSWGEESRYDSQKMCFYGAFAIPKDFDNLLEQKALLTQACQEGTFDILGIDVVKPPKDFDKPHDEEVLWVS